MNQDKKTGRKKPKLLIQVEDFQHKIDQMEKEQRFNGVIVKPLRSAKNVHQMRQFGFGDQVPQISQTARKLQKLKKLEEDKVHLIRSLEVLKESAVSAIAQKQDQITKLKMRTSFVQDQNMEVYEQKLYQQRQMRMTLEQQKDELLKQLKYERQLHIIQIQEKEILIEQLCAQISQVRSQIQVLECNEIAKNKTIRLLQQENSQLSEQLEISSISTALKERSEHYFDLNETIKAKPALSVASSIQTKKYYSYIQTTDYLFQSGVDKTYITEKMQEIKKAHREQLMDLRSFYEKRITGLRQLYSRQLNLPTEPSEAGSAIGKRKISISYERNEIKKQMEGLQLNLKEMHSIEESVENQLETSRSNLKNLKNQIRMQNLSQCARIQQRFNTNQDTESQFTTKYFDVPRFLKKNQSSDSITVNNDGDMKKTKKINQKQAQSSKCISRKLSEVELSLTPQPQTSKKSIFGAGFLSGIAFTTVLGLFFSKKSFGLK